MCRLARFFQSSAVRRQDSGRASAVQIRRARLRRRGAVGVADIGSGVYVRVRIVEIDGVVLIGRKRRTDAHHAAVIDVIDRSLIRKVFRKLFHSGLIVVCVVVMLDVVVRA